MPVNKQKQLLVCFVALALFLTGCVSIPQIQKGMDKVDDAWAVANENLVKTLGTREYRIRKKTAFRAMVIALTELGFIVTNQDLETGLILAKAPVPTPLSKSEWAAVKKIEEPKMQAMVSSDVGEFTANLFVLSDTNFNVILNVIMLERPKDLQISFHFQMEYTGPKTGIVYGQQPPPEAVKYSLKKAWNIFEKNAFIQKGTFK